MTRKQKLRRLRKLERRRAREKRRQIRARGGSADYRRREEESVGTINGIVLKRVTEGRRRGGGKRNRLSWRSKDHSRPPFEFLLKAGSEPEDTEDRKPSGGVQANSASNVPPGSSERPSLDYSDLPPVAGRGRTSFPRRDSEHVSEIHRKNWKRRRSNN